MDKHGYIEHMIVIKTRAPLPYGAAKKALLDADALARLLAELGRVLGTIVTVKP